MPVKPEAAVGLLVDETAHHVLRLRELLVRGDENLKAWQLLNAVPYWAQDHPAIVAAKADQYEMVRHALEPDWYEKYYATNPHERPFEEQYAPLTVETAHEGIPRFGILREWLKPESEVLDLSANDGAMAANLGLVGHAVDCLDLNPGCCERARGRRVPGYTGVGDVWQGNLNDPPEKITEGAYDAVVLFETIEHVPDPEATLKTCARYVKPGGCLYVSTPNGAVEGLDLPTWAHVESKGHIHAIDEREFLRLLHTVGTDGQVVLGPDNVFVAQVQL